MEQQPELQMAHQPQDGRIERLRDDLDRPTAPC